MPNKLRSHGPIVPHDFKKQFENISQHLKNNLVLLFCTMTKEANVQ